MYSTIAVAIAIVAGFAAAIFVLKKK